MPDALINRPDEYIIRFSVNKYIIEGGSIEFIFPGTFGLFTDCNLLHGLVDNGIRITSAGN
jgi:hypothetical protein